MCSGTRIVALCVYTTICTPTFYLYTKGTDEYQKVLGDRCVRLQANRIYFSTRHNATASDNFSRLTERDG